MKKPSLKVLSFEEAFSPAEFLRAHKICRRNKGHKRETIEFELNLFDNIKRLSDSILSGKYRITKYRKFEIYEPKKRIIESLSYKHRLVQFLLCKNILEPRLEPRLIYANSACRCGKGTDFARNLFEKYIKKVAKKYGNSAYFLKCDVRKYFASIIHKKLIEKLEKIGFEDKSFNLMKIIINSSTGEKGLPIGNLTSQWFALLYLNDIDRLIKEKHKIKYYVRYMDDLVMISNDYNQLASCKDNIISYGKSVGLFFNEKTQISKVCKGICFIGFRYLIDYRGRFFKLLTQKVRKKVRGNIKKIFFLYRKKVLDNEFAKARFESYLNFYKQTCMENSLVSARNCICRA